MAWSEVKMVEGSVEYLYADIRTDRVLDQQSVVMNVSDTDDPGTTWRDAEWVGPPGKFRSARILIDGNLSEGVYYIFAKITDAPEVPIIPVGKLRIT